MDRDVCSTSRPPAHFHRLKKKIGVLLETKRSGDAVLDLGFYMTPSLVQASVTSFSEFFLSPVRSPSTHRLDSGLKIHS